MKPYTYLIKWSKLGKSYYGAKYGKDANPSTFWKDYFTSSKYVQMMREEHGEPDVIQIRRTFDCREKALLWEKKVLTRIDAVNSLEYLNRGIGGSVMYEITPLAKLKMSEARKGVKKSAEWKRAISESLTDIAPSYHIKSSTGKEWFFNSKKEGIKYGFSHRTLSILRRDGSFTYTIKPRVCPDGIEKGTTLYLSQ